MIIPFTYLVSSGALAANAAGQVPLVLAADCAFELQGYVASCTEDADTDIIPNNFSVQIIDQSTGRLMSNIRVPQRMFASSTYNGMTCEKYPIRFPANCTLLFDFLNLTTNANTILVGLKGYKLYGA